MKVEPGLAVQVDVDKRRRGVVIEVRDDGCAIVVVVGTGTPRHPTRVDVKGGDGWKLGLEKPTYFGTVHQVTPSQLTACRNGLHKVSVGLFIKLRAVYEEHAAKFAPAPVPAPAAQPAATAAVADPGDVTGAAQAPSEPPAAPALPA